MTIVRRFCVLLALAFLATVSSNASGALVNKNMKAAKGEPLNAVVRSLELIADGKIDEWMETWCDKKSACAGNKHKARIMLKIARKKITKGCVKDDTVYVVQMTEKRDGRWMILTKCEDKRTVTFVLKKRGKDWKVKALS